jgi:hypothetical protein
MSTKSLHIDKRITSLELTGGKPCIFQQLGAVPDLYVYGGAHFKKECCFDGDTLFRKDLAVQGNLKALGDSRLPNIFSESITPLDDCIDIYGNLCVSGSANVDSLNVQKDTMINGNLIVIGNISGLQDFTDLHVTKTSQFDGDVTMFGNLIAAGPCLDIIGNVCITGELQVNNTAAFVNSWSAGATGLLPNTPSMGDIVLGGTLNVGHGGTGNNLFPVGAMLIGDGVNPIQTTMPITYGVGAFPNPVNTITGVPTPYNPSDVVPKSYVDAVVAGLNVHDSAYVASTGPLTATYTNGALGVGATLTNAGAQTYLVLDSLATTMIDVSSNGAILPVGVINVASTVGFPVSGDLLISASPTTLVSYTGITATSFTGCTGGSGTLMTGQSVTVALLVGSRVMIKNQSNQTQNGIYAVTVLGDASTNWVLTRSTDFDNSTPGEVTPGDFVFVSFGQLFGSTGWVQTNSGTGLFNRIILGTDNVVFTQFSSAGTYSAGTGLTLTGTTFSITNQIVAGTTAANQVPQITYNNQGQITSVGTTTLAIPVVMDNNGMPDKYPTAPQTQGVWYGTGTKAASSGANTVTIGNGASTGSGGTAIGSNANVPGINGIGLGLSSTASGDDSLAIGNGASAKSLEAIGIGRGATSTNGICIGAGANSSGGPGGGSSAIIIGLNAGKAAISGVENIGIGAYALSNLTSGSYNVAVGSYAQRFITSGVLNTGVGYQSLQNNKTVSAQTGFGYGTMRAVTSGGASTAVGSGALLFATSASNATAIGTNAMSNTSSALDSVAIGTGAMFSSVNPNTRNTAVGNSSLRDISGGTDNSAIGYQSGVLFSSGSNNVFVGSSSGASLSTGKNNTFVGYLAGSTFTSANNSACFGANAQPSLATVSNEVTIGDSAVTVVRSYGAWTFLSDARDKKDVTPFRAGLDFVSKLKPVDFVWNMRDGGKVGQHDCGFIAQDLQQAQEDTGLKIPGLVYDVNPDHLQISPDKMLPVLVKALQEANEEIQTLKTRLDALEPKVN